MQSPNASKPCSYSKSVHRVLLHCLLNIRDAFFYVTDLRLHKLKNCGIAKKSFLFHVLDFNATFANQDPLPTLRPGNFDLHTKIPGPTPARKPYGTQMSSLCWIYFSSAGRVNASAGVLFLFKLLHEYY